MTAVAEPTIGQLERRGRAEVSKTDIIRLLETLRTTSLNSAHAGAISACRAPSAAPRIRLPIWDGTNFGTWGFAERFGSHNERVRYTPAVREYRGDAVGLGHQWSRRSGRPVMSSGLPLLLEANPIRLARLHAGLRRAGIDAIAVTHIAEVERWPSDACVITDLAHVTPWWSEVGAIGVIALANTPEQGAAACQRGATTWLPRNCSIPTLVAAINALYALQQERPFGSAKRGRGLSDTRRVRIIKPMAGIVDGVSLSALVPGLIYELEEGLALYLMSCGAAEESAAMGAVSVVPPDDPYIAHVVGGVIVTQITAPPQETAADRPPKVRRLRKRKGKRR